MLTDQCDSGSFSTASFICLHPGGGHVLPGHHPAPPAFSLATARPFSPEPCGPGCWMAFLQQARQCAGSEIGGSSTLGAAMRAFKHHQQQEQQQRSGGHSEQGTSSHADPRQHQQQSSVRHAAGGQGVPGPCGCAFRAQEAALLQRGREMFGVHSACAVARLLRRECVDVAAYLWEGLWDKEIGSSAPGCVLVCPLICHLLLLINACILRLRTRSMCGSIAKLRGFVN